MTTEALQSLDDVLSGAEPAQPQTVETPAEAEPAEQPAEQPKEPTTGSETTKAEEQPKEEWTKKAVLDERRKRQEMERRIAELQKPAERPDLFADPDGALSHLESRFQQQMFASKVEMSQELMRSMHEDYDELETEFHELAKDNPVLLKQLSEAQNPARFAYETAMKARTVATINDADKLRAQVEAKYKSELEEKLRKEFEEKYGKETQKRAAVSGPSLAAVTGKTSINDQPNESLDSILKDRKKR